MPGMMDTVLNIGLNDETVKGVIAQTGNERFAYDAYRRFVNMYGDVVMGVQAGEKEEDPFELIMDAKKRAKGVEADLDLTAQDLKELVGEFKALIKQRTGQDFPEEPLDQLWGAIGAVFSSWNIPRAVSYREIHGISRATGARRSTCSPWSSATWARTRPPGWPLPATRPPARTTSTAST
jgi:pyruvate,orthophosphate dikinase